VDEDLPTITELDGVTRLVEQPPPDGPLFLRWSHGPAVDLADADGGSSRDSLTGVALPGLSATPLAVEAWWGDRSARLWAARRLYDYGHLRKRGERPWILVGDDCGRGPDNEPLVRCRRPVAWVADEAVAEARRLVEEQPSSGWGPLDRDASGASAR
jgi:hypothetical protein